MIGNCFSFKKDDNTKMKKNASFFWGKNGGRIVAGRNWEKSYIRYPNPNKSEKKDLLFPHTKPPRHKDLREKKGQKKRVTKKRQKKGSHLD